MISHVVVLTSFARAERLQKQNENKPNQGKNDFFFHQEQNNQKKKIKNPSSVSQFETRLYQQTNKYNETKKLTISSSKIFRAKKNF